MDGDQYHWRCITHARISGQASIRLKGEEMSANEHPSESPPEVVLALGVIT